MECCTVFVGISEVCFSNMDDILKRIQSGCLSDACFRGWKHLITLYHWYVAWSTHTQTGTFTCRQFAPEKPLLMKLEFELNIFSFTDSIIPAHKPSRKLFTHNNQASHHYRSLCVLHDSCLCNHSFWHTLCFRVNWHMNKSNRETFQLIRFKIYANDYIGSGLLCACLCLEIMVC